MPKLALSRTNFINRIVLALSLASATTLVHGAALADGTAVPIEIQSYDDGRVRIKLAGGAQVCDSASLTDAQEEWGEMRVGDVSGGAEAVEGVRQLAVAAQLSGRELKLYAKVVGGVQQAYQISCQIYKVTLL